MDKKFITFLAIAILAVALGGFIYFINQDISPISFNPTPTPKPAANPSSNENLLSIEPTKAVDTSIKSLGLTMDNYPLLDGATSTQPIRMLIACEAFDIPCKWYETESREMFLRADFYSAGITEYKETEKISAKIEKNSKTHEAYLSLIKDEADLILVSTRLSDDELKEAEKLGVKLDLLPVGLDGFIFLVNEKNPIKNLSTNEIVGIYSGKIKSWNDIAGIDPSLWDEFTGTFSSIKAFTRPVNSGSQELMEKLVMKGIAMAPSLKEEVIAFMSPLIDGVEVNANSIGYSLYYYKNNMIDKREYRSRVKLVAVDGIEPNPENIASKAYPYVFNIYAVTREDEPKNSPAYRIKEWLVTKEGQEIIKKAGYVGLGD